MLAAWYIALANFFGQARHVVRDNKAGKVPIVFANTDRAEEAILQYMKEEKRKMSAAGKGQAPQVVPDSSFDQSEEGLPSPFFSLYIQDPKFNSKYFNPSQVTYGKDLRAGMALSAPVPRPMKARVELNLYANGPGAEEVAQSLFMQIEMLFRMGTVTRVPVNYSDANLLEAYKSSNVFEYLKDIGAVRGLLYVKDGWTNTTDLEMFDRTRRRDQHDKKVRHTWDGELHVPMPYPFHVDSLLTEIAFQLYYENYDTVSESLNIEE